MQRAGRDGRPPTSSGVVWRQSVVDWPPFPNSAAALARLKERFALAVITNCDDDLFAASTGGSASTSTSSSPPSSAEATSRITRNFEIAFERIGRPKERILHVAQSLFHDHVPAKAMGMTTVWINRRHDRSGTGATPPADATPDLITPDMATFAELATA